MSLGRKSRVQDTCPTEDCGQHKPINRSLCDDCAAIVAEVARREGEAPWTPRYLCGRCKKTVLFPWPCYTCSTGKERQVIRDDEAATVGVETEARGPV